MTLRRAESPTGTNSPSVSSEPVCKSVLFIFGTRPEAIKLCPLIAALRQSKFRAKVIVCVTGQHREMLHQVLDAFQVTPDFDLDVMTPGQTLNTLASLLLAGLEGILKQVSPALTVVQGDTTTALCGALASYHQRVPIAHVEAGLRTHDLASPFPEEGNRLLTDCLSGLHFAATTWAADNLLREGHSERSVVVTGNTGIDAVFSICQAIDQGRLAPHSFPVDWSRRLILVTAHRRESFGPIFDEICRTIATLSEREDVQILWPVHPNPHVRASVDLAVRGKSNVILTEPLDYVSMVFLMRRSYFIMTDSGGIQEEATALGTPVLILREKTERPEALLSQTAKLAGIGRESILLEAGKLLDDEGEYARRAHPNVAYGDGQASQRIVERIESFLFPQPDKLT